MKMFSWHSISELQIDNDKYLHRPIWKQKQFWIQVKEYQSWTIGLLTIQYEFKYSFAINIG